MDNLENYYHENRDSMDHRNPPNGAWDSIDASMNADDAPDGPKSIAVPYSRRRYVVRVAAILMLLLGGGGAWYFVPKDSDENIGLEQNQLFPDIVLETPEGELMPLSSLKGKVVLVEFWSSGSTICTNENCYYFEPVYQDFKDDGFEVYAVSLDNNREEWVNGIERDKLPWIQVSDLKGENSEIAEKFHINQLPATFLLDREGRIVERNIDATELRGKLAELLAEK
jgi:peroxiredoxin